MVVIIAILLIVAIIAILLIVAIIAILLIVAIIAILLIVVIIARPNADETGRCSKTVDKNYDLKKKLPKPSAFG